MDDLFISADEAFVRASRLEVSSLLVPIREVPRWATDTGRDLRRRAAIGRLQTGDPFAGLAWTGFSPLEIAATGDKLDPASLVYVNSVAEWAIQTGNTDYTRKPGESLDDYFKRLQAALLAKAIPALEPHQATVANILEIVGDIRQIGVTVRVVATQSFSLGHVLFANKVWRPLLAQLTQGTPLQGMVRTVAPVRSLTAPGTYLSSLMRNLFMRSRLYRDYVARLPNHGEMDLVGKAVKAGRAIAGMRVNQFLDIAFGNDRLAALLGGKNAFRRRCGDLRSGKPAQGLARNRGSKEAGGRGRHPEGQTDRTQQDRCGGPDRGRAEGARHRR